MAPRLRFLLDTNVLLPLQDSYQVLETNLANFVRLASVGGHQLLYHSATVADFERDADDQRKARNLQRIAQYPALDNTAPCPWNTSATSANDEVIAFARAESDHAASVGASLAVPLMPLDAPTPAEFEAVLAGLLVSR